MSDKYGRNESNDIIADLNSLKPEKQKEAVKKVISAMTIGRDVSKLFAQVVKCIATTDVELKKLVYLYIINYSRTRPSEALLAVNYFKKDSSSSNPNPFLRALAVRTMGCLGVEQIMQFLCDPLKDALKDQDPYVRKTAVLCVSKIYDINKAVVEEQFCFIDTLQKLIEDEGNSMVIANCVASLSEISVSKGEDVLKINWKKCKCLMNALFENNEWCQIYLLEGISRYNPETNDQINEIIERVVPFVSHSNSAVVLTGIKILIKLLDLVQSADTIRSVCKKITPSLVTLLSTEPEIIYVALKNINLLIQKRPIIFEKDIKMFFCTFNEPIYNKMEKLEILYKLVSMNNVDLVLNELVEYASEVDVQFVRRSVRLIGQCAIKLEKAAQRCVEKLVELVKSQVSFVIQESIIALRDIFRRYPNTYEGAMQTVNENLRTLNDSDAKSALIWIIGEYADRIDGAEAQISKFLDNLREEPYNVQMSILTSSVKTYLKLKNEESFNILDRVFNFCFTDADNPDLRDRGYFYWRLMSIDPAIACNIVLAEKPRISEDVSNIEGVLLDKLIDNLGSLSTVYAKVPELFVKKGKKINLGEEEEEEFEDQTFTKEIVIKSDDIKAIIQNTSELVLNERKNEIKEPPKQVNLLDLDGIMGSGNSQVNQSYQMNQSSQLDISQITQNNENTRMNQGSQLLDLNLLSEVFGGPSKVSKVRAVIPRQIVVQETQQGKNGNNGLIVESAIQREEGRLYLYLSFTNNSNMDISDFRMGFNVNYFGVQITNQSGFNGFVVKNGSIGQIKLEISTNINPDNTKIPENIPYSLMAAIRCSLDEFYFNIPIMFSILFENENDRIDMDTYKQIWTSIQTTQDMCYTITSINQKFQSSNSLIERFEANGIYLLHKIENNDQDQLFFYGRLSNGEICLVSIAYSPNTDSSSCNLIVKSEQNAFIKTTIHSAMFLLRTDC